MDVLLGLGGGAFGAETPLLVAPHYNALVAEDVDGDGDSDVVTISTSAQLLTVLDNTLVSPWSDLGSALGGSAGAPCLTGTGPLVAGSTTALRLRNALPLTQAYLLVGYTQLNAPFAGGNVVPNFMGPGGAMYVFSADTQGGVDVFFTWPAGVVSGFEFHTQYWMLDATGPFGLTASNGLRGKVP